MSTSKALAEPQGLKLKEALLQSNQIYLDVALHGLDSDSAIYALARRVVLDPLWLPIVEMVVNGITTYQGGLLLKGASMLQGEKFTIKRGKESGKKITVYYLNQTAENYFNSFRISINKTLLDKWMLAFSYSVQSYAAIDLGAGLIANNSVIKAALEHEDWELLTRLRSLKTTQYYFQNHHSSDNLLSEHIRKEYFQMIARSPEEYFDRQGAEIIVSPK